MAHRFYATPTWRKRREHQLAIEPLCRFCREHGVTRPAEVPDHIVPHRGDWEAFATGELQSLCKKCHDSVKQSEERLGYSKQVGADGWPLDPRHPANRV